MHTESIDSSYAAASGTLGRLLRAAILALLLPVGGCLTPTPAEPPPATGGSTPAVSTAEPSRPPEPAPAPPPAAAEVAALPPASARTPAAAPRPSQPQPRPPVLQPEALIGLSREETLVALGPPETRQERAPATVWAYRVGDCTLEIFFYVNVSTRETRALATNVLAPSDTEAGRRTCAQRILAERHVRR